MIEYFDKVIQALGLTKIITILVVLFFTIVLSKTFKILLKRHSKLSNIDMTNYKFLGHVTSAIIYLVGIGIIIYLIPPLRALSVSMLAGAGILAVVVGFASQQAFSNVVSGIFIIISKPYHIGDRLKIRNDILGIVEDITLRHTVIKTFENKRVIIPNAIMNSEVIENANIQDEKVCKFIDVGISYDSDIDKAMKIMKEESMKHPDFLDNRTKDDKKKKVPAVNIKVIKLDEYSVNLRAWVWAKDPSTGFRMGCDLRKNIKEKFDKAKIEIPYPYRTIVTKKK